MRALIVLGLLGVIGLALTGCHAAADVDPHSATNISIPR